jgi:hypothetical protein
MENNKPSIPYALKSLIVRYFRGIKDIRVEGLNRETNWVFLTGRNGYGKTCLLQALFLGLWGKLDAEGVLLAKEVTTSFFIRLEGYAPSMEESFVHEVKPSTVMGILGAPDTVHKVPVVAYGPSRLSLQASASKNEERQRSAVAYSLFNADGVLLNIENELKSWFFRSESRELSRDESRKMKGKYEAVKNALIQLLPNIVEITPDPRKDLIYYTELSEGNVPLTEKRTLEEIPSGSKSILAMIGDLMIRLFRTQPQITDPKALAGIVLIDEIDLHLHPEWQYELPSLLSSVFPKIQFIASTHSPIPLLGAPAQSAFFTVGRTKEEGITIKRLAIEIEELTPNLILTSEVFGFYDIIAKSNTSSKHVRTEDTMQEKSFRDELKRRLQVFEEQGGKYEAE